MPRAEPAVGRTASPRKEPIIMRRLSIRALALVAGLLLAPTAGAQTWEYKS